jgi:hypothetical protein
MRVDLSKEGRGSTKSGRQREKTRCGEKTERKHPAPLQDENGGREGHEKNRGDGVGQHMAAKRTDGGHQDEGKISRQEKSGYQQTQRAREHENIIIFEKNIVKTFYVELNWRRMFPDEMGREKEIVNREEERDKNKRNVMLRKTDQEEEHQGGPEGQE